LPRDREEWFNDGDRGMNLDHSTGSKHDDARALCLASRAQTAGSGIVEGGDFHDLTAPAAWRFRAKPFGTGKGRQLAFCCERSWRNPEEKGEREDGTAKEDLH